MKLKGRTYLLKKDSGLEYSTSPEESFIIDSCRIPKKGLEAVYVEHEVIGRRYRPLFVNLDHVYELEFCYEDGIHFSVSVYAFYHERDFGQLIRRYDDSIKIYIHQKLKESGPLFSPFQRFRAEEPVVGKEVLEELNTLCNGNSFWCLTAKSRYKWNGNTEVELTLYGTALTWLIWLVWLCLSVYLFFYFSSVLAELLVLSGAGLYYYLFFIRSARKITEKAKAICNEAIFDRKSRL